MTALDTEPDHTTPSTSQQVIEAARALGPTIAGRAADVERARRVPRDLLDTLIDTGCFRMIAPRTHGGLSADLPDALRLFETLAEADASVAWTVMIGGAGWIDLATLPRATFDALFPADRPNIVAGAFNPTGKIAPTADGYRVTGRWSLASGCEHATVLFGNSIEGFVDGAPVLRLSAFRPDQVQIEDTWYAVGLSGSGSHHFSVTDLALPADHTSLPLSDPPCLDEPVLRIPLPTLAPLAITSVAIGTARAALDDIITLARHRVPLFSDAPLAAGAVFRAELAERHTALAAARGLLRDVTYDLWTSALAGSFPTLDQRAAARVIFRDGGARLGNRLGDNRAVDRVGARTGDDDRLLFRGL